jgi:hypothetical protein
MNQGGLGDLGNLDVATLQKHLPGVRFPAERDQVANTAEKNDAPKSWWSGSGTPTPNASTAPMRSCGRCKAASAEPRFAPSRWARHRRGWDRRRHA